MTLQFSAPLQKAVFEILGGYAPLTDAQIGIFDDPPHRNRSNGDRAYVVLGDETITPWNSATDIGAVHDVIVSVYAKERGFRPAKTVAAHVHDAITTFTPLPSVGRVVRHEFIAAKTGRESQGALRRIDLTFRFVIEDNAAA